MGLELAFRSRELRSTCESPARAKRELGEIASRVLQRHLADVQAAETAAELVDMGLGIEHCAQEPGLLRFHLDGGVCLVCQVNHRTVPMNGPMIDWTQVTRLQVVRIGDCQ